MSSDSSGHRRKGRRPPIPTVEETHPAPPVVESTLGHDSAAGANRPAVVRRRASDDSATNDSLSLSQESTPSAKSRFASLALVAGCVAVAFAWLFWSINEPASELAVERGKRESHETPPTRQPTPSPSVPSRPPEILEAPPSSTLPPGPEKRLPLEPPPRDLHDPPPQARSVYWAADAGFPLEYGNAWAELQSAREMSETNVLAKRKRIAEGEARLKAVVEAAHDGSRKQARMMVVAVSPEKVTVLADVSAGWLVEGTPVAVGRKTYSKFPTAWNVVWLSTTGEAVAGIELRVGNEIADWRAEGLQWGDVLYVSFDVTEVRELPPSVGQDASAAPAVLVTVADLRCFDRVKGARPEQLWPYPESLPRIIYESPRYAYDLTPLFAPAPLRVRAKVGVERVNEREIVLHSYLRSPDYFTIVRLHAESEAIAVPVDAVGEEAAAGLGPFAKLILEFTVKTLTPAGGRGRTGNVALDAEITDVRFISVDRPSGAR